MQRHGQRHIGLFGKLVDLRHQSRSRQRHTPPRQVEPVVVQQNAQGRHDVTEVGERLAHSHQHDIGHDAIATGLEAELALREPDLPDDLRSREVAVESLLRGRAEGAIENTTNL